jgi:hypothetical protein
VLLHSYFLPYSYKSVFSLSDEYEHFIFINVGKYFMFYITVYVLKNFMSFLPPESALLLYGAPYQFIFCQKGSAGVGD